MTIEKLEPTFCLAQDLLEQLKQLIPEAIADGKINWETFKEILGEHLEEESVEHFGLNWTGKRQARQLASMPSKGTLVPMPGEGIDEETTGNIFIEGDNLEVLKILQKSYAGRIKLIYIDPPYNTGNDFIYKDDFREPLNDYLKKTNQSDEEGNLLTSNPKSGGRFHSNWLNMMYPRLRLAKNLLTDDGLIFISIDDNEVHNLRQILNEFFGEENFVAQIIIQSNKRGQTYKQISKTHEYLICYANEPDAEIRELEKESSILQYTDMVGMYDIRELRNRNPKFGSFNRPNLFFPIYVSSNIKDKDGFHAISLEYSEEFCIEVFPLNSEGKESCWRWGKPKISQQNLFDVTKAPLVSKQRRDKGWNIYEKYRKTTYKAKSIWEENEVISEQGTIDLKEIGLKGFFDFPKPVHLIKKLITLGSEEDDLVLDFFAGSGTLAQALLELNSLDGGKRKFICVQTPDKYYEESEAQKAGFTTISDVSKERIRRVIEKVKQEISRQLNPREDQQDLGFKVYKLDHSNLKIWEDCKSANVQVVQQSFLEFQVRLVEGWTEDKVITEVQLLEGFLLDSRINKVEEFAKNRVLCVSSNHIEHRLFICLDLKLDTGTLEKVRTLGDEDVFICLDNALTDTEKMQFADVCNVKTI